MKISFVILTYNSEEMIEASLLALSESLKPDEAEIIVIDNGSKDNSPIIAQKYNQVNLIRLDKNIFFSAINKCIPAVTGDILVVMNPDIIMTREAFLGMKDFMQTHPNVVAAGPRHLRSDGSIELTARKINSPLHCFWTQTFIQAFFPSTKQFYYKDLTSPSMSEDASPVQVLQDSCIWIRASIFKRVGGYASSLKLYYTEDDLCLRLSKYGALYYLPKIMVTHFQGSSVRKEPSFLIRKIMSFDMLQYLKLHFGFCIYIFFFPLTYLSIIAWWIMKKFWVGSKHYSLRG